MNKSDPAIPCGLVAKSFFNDTFKLYKQAGSTKNPSVDQEITIKSDNIAWSSDIQYKFANIKSDTVKGYNKGKTYEELQWKDMTDRKLLITLKTPYRALHRVDANGRSS